MTPQLNDTIYYIDSRDRSPQSGTLIYIQGVHMVAERANGFRDYVHEITLCPPIFDI